MSPRRRLAAALLAAVLGTAAAARAQAPSSVPVTPAAPAILVVPFEDPQRDPRGAWLGEAAAILITDDLNARRLGAITRVARARAFEQLHLPVDATLSRATVIKVGQIVGATRVIVGDLQLDGDSLIVHASPIRIDVGRVDPEITERGPLRDLFEIFSRLAGRLEPGGTAAGEPARPPLEALEPYVKGLLAESPATQATFLDTAVTRDPSYDRARLALWSVRTEQGDHAAALAAVRGIADTSPLVRRARFLAAVSLLELHTYDESFEAFTRLDDERADASVLNDLGVLQLRRGSDPATGTPIYYFTKATGLEPDDPDLLFNLGYAYARDRDNQGAIYWLREALRRNPADADAHVVLASALEAAGRGIEAARERDLAGQLSARWSARSTTARSVPRGLERVRRDLQANRYPGVRDAITTSTQRDQTDLAAFHLDRGRRLFSREQDREAMAELRRVVYLSPYEAEAHLLIGRIHLRGGRSREAIDALKISIWSQDTAAARVAMAQAYLALDDAVSARAQVARALALDPESADAKQLQRRLDGGSGGRRPR